MKKYCNENLFQLEEKLKELSLEIDEPIFLSEIAIKTTLDCLTELKKFILERRFKNDEEEIYFFKCLKPQILSKLIYYNAIFKIETKKPFGCEKTLRKYLHKELEKLKRFFDNNLEFYKYYRTNSAYLDHKYFVRGKHDIKLSLDTFYFEADHSFSTSHDYKVAKIIANDLIQVYLEGQLYNKSQGNKLMTPPNLKWTGSKVALIELVYALYYQGVFDNGNADIRLIAKYFESNFNIDLGNFYQTYLELRSRKMNRTKFLDALREELIRRMDEQDEK